MARKLTNLADEQWAGVEAAREAALRSCLVDGVTRDEFTEAVARCYAHIGEAAPAVVVAPGPLAALMWAAILRVQLGGQLDDQLYTQLYDQLGGQLRYQLDVQLGGQLRGQLYDQLRVQLCGQLYDQLDVQLGGQLRGQLYDQLDVQLGGQLYDQLDVQLGGQLRGQLYDQLDDQLDAVHWSWWRQSWFRHWLHINQLDGITPVDDETRQVAEAYVTLATPVFTIPLRGVVIGVGPHLPPQRDRDHRLHCTTGPAWAWPDGTAIYALDGIRVPAWVITEPDAKRIVNELPNTEQRRVALAHLGWDRAVDELGLRQIDAHDDPHMGTLYQLPDDVAEGRATLLVARNASPNRDGSWNTYGLLAAPTCRTVIEAQASLAQLSVDDFLALDGAS